MTINTLDRSKHPLAENLIAICKSNSGKIGLELRNAHYQLGGMLAYSIFEHSQKKEITVVIMMRAGLCFGMGIADKLENLGCRISVLFYYNDTQWKKEKENCENSLSNQIIIVDSVINTGVAITKFAESFENTNIVFATNVLSNKALRNFNNGKVYVVRISENSFVGAKTDIVKNNKGPDTGDRLFNTNSKVFNLS